MSNRALLKEMGDPGRHLLRPLEAGSNMKSERDLDKALMDTTRRNV